MFSGHVRDVAVIGAGVAGIATARALLARGFDCTLFERGERLGGVWCDGYANFGTQVQRELYEFPDRPHGADVPDFTPGPQVRDYLEDAARDFGVLPRIRFRTRVAELRRRAPEPGWLLTWEADGVAGQAPFDAVVVCTGLYSNRPHAPTFEAQDTFRGQIIHVSAFRDRDQLAGRRVAVVGFGKSASDAALESSMVAAATHLVYRAPHWPVPPLLLGVLPFKWAMLTRLASTLVPPYYRPSRLERVLHGPGRPLVWLWWRVVERLLAAQYGLGSRGGTRPSLVPRDPVEFDAFGESVMLPRPGFYPALRTGAIEPLEGRIARYTPSGIVLTDGTRRDVDTVVLATGWEADYGLFDDATRVALGLGDDGLYLYRQMIPPDVDDIAFVGYAATIASILTYSLQARWLADHLAGACQLPDAGSMRADVEDLRAWKRRRLPPSRSRAARLLLYMQHYHDQLVADLGVSPLRKQGVFAPFKEVFGPYGAADYRAVVPGERADGA